LLIGQQIHTFLVVGVGLGLLLLNVEFLGLILFFIFAQVLAQVDCLRGQLLLKQGFEVDVFGGLLVVRHVEAVLFVNLFSKALLGDWARQWLLILSLEHFVWVLCLRLA